MRSERNERLRAPSVSSVGRAEDEQREVVESVTSPPTLNARPSSSARQTSAASSSSPVSLFNDNYWSSEDSSDAAGEEGSDKEDPTLATAEEGAGSEVDLYEAEWNGFLSKHVGENAILEQVRVGMATLQLPSSRAVTEALLNDTPQRHRKEFRRYNHYTRFCRDNNIPAFPISVHIVEFYLTQRQYREPGPHVATLERIRQATHKLWSGREGHAGEPLEAYMAIDLLLKDSAFFKSLQGAMNASEEADEDDSDGEDSRNGEKSEIRGLVPSSSRRPTRPRPAEKSTSTSVAASGPRTVSPRKRRAAPEISHRYDSEKDGTSPHPSPKKRTKSTFSSRRAFAIPVTRVDNAAASSSTNLRSTIQQQQQQRNQSHSIPFASTPMPTPTPTPSPAVAAPTRPLPAPPLPPQQAELPALDNIYLSPLNIQHLLAALDTLLDDALLATTLHDLGITTTSAFSHLIVLDQQSCAFEEVLNQMERSGVSRVKCIVLGKKLEERRATSLRQ